MKIDKTKVKRISRQPSPAQIVTNQKQPESMGFLNNLDSMETNNNDIYWRN